MDGRGFDILIDSLQEANAINNYLPEEEQDSISEEEALEIYNEIIRVLEKHNLSYRNACNVAISLLYALLSGEAELLDMEEE